MSKILKRNLDLNLDLGFGPDKPNFQFPCPNKPQVLLNAGFDTKITGAKIVQLVGQAYSWAIHP